MTDEQIIKALRYCNGVDCENCKALDFCDYQHAGRLASCAYVVIRRQQAKIERKTKEIKSEVIKEFAERLKRVISDERFSRYGIEYEIDRIAKEMTEVQR